MKKRLFKFGLFIKRLKFEFTFWPGKTEKRYYKIEFNSFS